MVAFDGKLMDVCSFEIPPCRTVELMLYGDATFARLFVKRSMPVLSKKACPQTNRQDDCQPVPALVAVASLDNERFMNEKKQSIITSLWFTAAMSVVSLVVLVEKLVTLSSGDTRNLILIPIWVVIAYHFISVSYRSWKQSSGQE